MTHVTRLPALVSLNQLTYQFANGETLLDALNLSFDRLPTAIVGRNGVGKSLLLRLIAGDLQPSSGSISHTASVAYVPQDPQVQPGQSVAQVAGLAETLGALERLADGSASLEDLHRVDDRWDLAQRLRLALDEAGLEHVEPQGPADVLSGGQLARVVLIGALLGNADLLLLDEPSNHLDRHGRRWLTEQLQGWRGGLILVSHDRQLLMQVQRIVELGPQGAQVYGGNYALYQAQRQAHSEAAQAALDHARTQRSREHKRLQREHDTIQRHAAASRRHAKTANVSGFERAKLLGAARDIMGQVRHAHQGHKSELDEQVRDAFARVGAHSCIEPSARREITLGHWARARLPLSSSASGLLAEVGSGVAMSSVLMSTGMWRCPCRGGRWASVQGDARGCGAAASAGAVSRSAPGAARPRCRCDCRPRSSPTRSSISSFAAPWSEGLDQPELKTPLPVPLGIFERLGEHHENSSCNALRRSSGFKPGALGTGCPDHYRRAGLPEPGSALPV